MKKKEEQIDVIDGSINSSINESNAPLNSQPNILSSILSSLINCSLYKAHIEISFFQRQHKI